MHIYLLRMSHKEAGGADDTARSKKCKHNSLTMLEKLELLKKLEKGTSIKTLCEHYDVRSSTGYGLKKQKEQNFHFFAENESQKSLECQKI